MAISRSNERAGAFEARVELFSGRPNPEWKLGAAAGAKLMRIWDCLQTAASPAPAPPQLGYRGCVLREPDAGREWHAFGGVVTFRGGSAAEPRSDPQRTFEKAVLSSAPSGVLPPELRKLFR